MYRESVHFLVPVIFFKLYFFIAGQIVHVAQLMLFNGLGNLGNLSSNK